MTGPVYVWRLFNMGIYKDIARHQPYHAFDGPGELTPGYVCVNDARKGLCDL